MPDYLLTLSSKCMCDDVWHLSQTVGLGLEAQHLPFPTQRESARAGGRCVKPTQPYYYYVPGVANFATPGTFAFRLISCTTQ